MNKKSISESTVKDNYNHAFTVAMQIFALACKCAREEEKQKENAVIALDESQYFTGARIL